jgi:serine phosphatase RsbU (regulator of sigma subunit)
MADWCTIFLQQGSVVTSEVAHEDPEMIKVARELQQRFPFNAGAPVGAPAVMRTGRTEYYPTIPDGALGQIARDEHELDAMRSLDPRSIIVVPLRTRDSVIGAMQLARTGRPSRPYTLDDVATAEAGAARVAAIIDNFRLIDRQRTIAATLQRSLLPASLPEVPGVELAVRYWAAGEGTEVGGDFYDAFELSDQRWAVVIGDVCGSGPTAAAVTAVARQTIRAAARHGVEPTEVLAWVNEAVHDATTDLFCTVLYSTLERRGDRWSFASVSGGHPLPILVRKGGRATILGQPGTLLGVFPATRAHRHVEELEAGDTILLYTDGITDVPTNAMTADGLRELTQHVVATSLPAAEAIASALGEAIAEQTPLAERVDDIALIVIHVR